jgi:hypothetical protein
MTPEEKFQLKVPCPDSGGNLSHEEENRAQNAIPARAECLNKRIKVFIVCERIVNCRGCRGPLAKLWRLNGNKDQEQKKMAEKK